MIYKKSTKISNICQLVNANLFTPIGSDTYNYAGITVTKNISAGTLTFNGTSTSNFWYHVHDAGSELKYTNLIKGYKYYISGLPVNDLGVVFQLTSLFNLQGEQIFTAPRTSDGTGAFNIYVPKGVTLTNFVVTPQLFNLTEMYGKGYEPTTVEEFKSRWYKNLFDIGKVQDGSSIKVAGKDLFVTNYGVNVGLLKDLCPSIKAGDTVVISFKLKSYTSEVTKPNFLQVQNTIHHFSNLTFTVTEEGLNQPLYLYKSNYEKREEDCQAVYTDFQIEIGSTATPYVPYTPNPAPYRPYCFIDSRKKAIKVSDIMQIVGKPINGAGTTKELYGITYNFLADGTGVTLTGTATYTSIVQYFTFWRPVSGHKYLWLYGLENRGESKAYFEIKWTDKNGTGHWFSDAEQIYTLSPTATEGYATRIDFHLIVPVGQTCNGFTWHPQCFDLTEMYGAGNEPTTVEEFKSRWYRNLFSPSIAVGTLSGWSNTTPRQFEEGKWYIGITANNYYSPNNIVEYEFTENYVYVNTKGNGYGIGRAFKCEPNQTYTVSCKWIKNTNYIKIATSFFDENGNYLFFISAGDLAERHTFTTPANCKWFTVCFAGITAGTLYVYNIQLEKGSTATDYVPYTPNPAPYRPYCFVDSRKNTIKVSDICQLLDKSKYPATVTRDGITFTNNGNGTITVNGTNTGGKGNKYTLQTINLIGGHKYYINHGSGQAGTFGTIILTIDNVGTSSGQTGNIFIQHTSITNRQVYFYIGENAVIDNITFKPQLFDLTEMYGAGNEPKTVEEFKSRWYKNLCDFTKLFNSTIDKQFNYLGFWQVEISVKSNTEYTLSRLNNDVINLGTTYLGMDNVSRGEHAYSCWLNHNGIPSYCRKSITLTSSSDGKLWIFFSSAVYDAYKNGQNPFGYLQLEEGSTATSYVPYTPNPAPYRPHCFI